VHAWHGVGMSCMLGRRWKKTLQDEAHKEKNDRAYEPICQNDIRTTLARTRNRASGTRKRMTWHDVADDVADGHGDGHDGPSE